MSFSFVVHDTVSLNRIKRRSPLTCPKRPDAPVPPTLLGSPHLFSPNSIFMHKSSLSKWPSHAEDEWLRDMVPLDRSDDGKSEAESTASTPSPTTSVGPNPFCTTLVPPRAAGTQRVPSVAAHTPHST